MSPTASQLSDTEVTGERGMSELSPVAKAAISAVIAGIGFVLANEMDWGSYRRWGLNRWLVLPVGAAVFMAVYLVASLLQAP